MTTATFAGDAREILEDTTRQAQDGRHERIIRYRWHVGDASGIQSGSRLVRPLDRAILMDRWYRMLYVGGDTSETLSELDEILSKLVEGVLGRTMEEDTIVDDQPVVLSNVLGIDSLEEIIRDWILDRVGDHAR